MDDKSKPCKVSRRNTRRVGRDPVERDPVVCRSV